MQPTHRHTAVYWYPESRPHFKVVSDGFDGKSWMLVFPRDMDSGTLYPPYCLLAACSSSIATHPTSDEYPFTGELAAERLEVIKKAPIYTHDFLADIKHTVGLVTAHFPNHTSISVARMCAKLEYDLLNKTLKPIERTQTATKIKSQLKKLLTKCSKFKLETKHPRIKGILQGIVVPDSHVSSCSSQVVFKPVKARSKKSAKSTSTRRSKRNQHTDTDSDEEGV